MNRLQQLIDAYRVRRMRRKLFRTLQLARQTRVIVQRLSQIRLSR